MPIKVFIIIPDKSESATSQERLSQAEESLKNAGDGFAIERISQADVLSLGKTKSYSQEHLFVASRFEGKAFDHLIAIGCRIYGAPCVLQCITRRVSLPRNQPLYAQLLGNVLICCSGLERDMKDRIFKLTRWLGGDYKLDLTAEVTHLVANKVGSPKYMAFIRLNKPIVTTDWIEDLWRIAEKCYPFPDDLIPKSVTKNVLPPFAGLVVCSTGFKDDERRYFKQQVESHGGIFSGQMRQGECTHLIVRELHGDKYEAALSWGDIKIVSASWLRESVHAGCCLPEGNYVIHGPRIPNPEEVVSATNIPIDEPVVVEKLVHEKAIAPVLSSFMSDCSIYLHKIPGSLIDEIKKMIANSGGMYVVEPLEIVTHVIAMEQDFDDAQDIVNNNCSLAQIVSPDWVRQSFATQKLLDEANFDLKKLKMLTEAIERQRNSTILAEQTTISFQEDIVNDISVAGGASMSYSRLSVCNSINSSSLRRIALDGFKPRSERLSEAHGIFKKVECELVHINPATTPDSIDLLIIPFGQPPSPPIDRLINSGVVCVNSLFLEIVKAGLDKYSKSHRNFTQALPLRKLVPDIEEQIDNPVIRTLSHVSPCLENCCITLTGFDQPDRTLLVRLVIALGAAHQELFAKNATNSRSMQLQKSTHLIAGKASGEKFEKAKQWHVPALKKDWLIECWKAGCRVSEEDYSLVPVQFNATLNETSYPADKSVLNVTKPPIEEDKQIDVEPEIEISTNRLPPVTPNADEKSLISRRLDAILAASKSSDNTSAIRRQSRMSPAKTPKTPSIHHEHANFVAPTRPQVHYGVESSQSLQVMWGDDCASNKFSLGFERIDEEPLSAVRLKSLTLVEDALSSPNTSSMNCDSAGHPKCSPIANNANSNSEPALIRAPDAVVIRSNAGFPFDRKFAISGGAQIETNITRNTLSPPVFQFTGLTASERDDAAALLESLGAKVVATPVTTMGEAHVGASLTDSPIEASCTHLIVAEPSRTQKFLSGIASGKWVLHRSYIDACRAGNRLVDETSFEWGSSRCADPPASACKGDFQLAKRLAQSAHRWRLRLAGTNQKAFSDWRVILLVANPQVEQSFRQILISGGASIVQLPHDFSPPAVSSFTHWLVEPGIVQMLATQSANQNNSPARPGRLQMLRKSYDCLLRFFALCGGPEAPNGGGCVVRHDYLQSYLLHDPPPSIRQNLVNPSQFQPLPPVLGSSSSISSNASSPARKLPSSVLAQNNASDDGYAHADKRLRTVYSSSNRPLK